MVIIMNPTNMAVQIQKETEQAVRELLAQANLKPGNLFVIGCSTSEVAGKPIGKSGSLEIAAAIFDGEYPLLQAHGVALAAQCCEHLNRALVVERTVAECLGFRLVSAIPHSEAGGSFAAETWRRFQAPVLVEEVSAHAGMDIGATLIGMHLLPVAVPVRVSLRTIGEAILICAKTRPKYIGGSRTMY